MKRTMEDLIEIGFNLLAAKERLPHGQFGPWLRLEFGWSRRMAQNFMAVAEAFGLKCEIIADFQIQPTAAYLLAAPSVPAQAREVALRRAEAGETITVSTARKIIVANRPAAESSSNRAVRKDATFEHTMQRLQRQLAPGDVISFLKKLRDYADTLERSMKGDRPCKKRQRAIASRAKITCPGYNGNEEATAG